MMSNSTDERDATATYQLNDFIALEMARLAAERLDEIRISRFAQDIEKLRSRSDNRYLQAWETAIKAGPEALRRVMLETTDRGQVMRSAAMFRAFVSPQERSDLILRYSRQRVKEPRR
jgi:hypothetical protein